MVVISETLHFILSTFQDAAVCTGTIIEQF